ncbi:MAG: hypothetical protein ACLFT8_02470, partial [Desulfovermiculus sp.]
HLAPLGILAALSVLDIRPFTMSGHTSYPPHIHLLSLSDIWYALSQVISRLSYPGMTRPAPASGISFPLLLSATCKRKEGAF